jgi:hypothetical protein
MRLTRLRTTRLRYYLRELAKLALPDSFFVARLDRVRQRIDETDAQVRDRVDYYNRLDAPFDASGGMSIGAFRGERKSSYQIDLANHLRVFPGQLRVRYVFGDVTEVPPEPAFVKSRPIGGDVRNSVLMKLNATRHFVFVEDRVPWERKRDALVWRGRIHRHNLRERRLDFLRHFHGRPRFDVGHIDRDADIAALARPFQTISEQLQYKFILSLEGNDVATNLKWIMSSSSLCFSCRPRFETWFMEGRLVAGEHYVEVADDFSDLEAKIDHYLAHPDEARTIVANANAWVRQFQDAGRERLVAHLVVKRWFELSGQLPR